MSQQPQPPRSEAGKLIACHACDKLIRLPHHNPRGSTLVCPRCSTTLTRGHQNPLDTVIALSVSALILLLSAGSFAFIGVLANGQQRTIGLSHTILELFNTGYSLLAVMVLLFAIVFPAMYLLALLTLTVPVRFLKLRTTASTLTPKHYRLTLGKLLRQLRPWVMAEVFLIGVLVSMVKLIEMAQLTLGLSFWAYLLFAMMFSYIAVIADEHRIAHWIHYDLSGT